MLSDFFKNLIILFTVTVIVFIISTILFNSVLEQYYLPVFPYLLGFFFIVNALVLFIKFKAFRGSPKRFPMILMGANGLRIFAYLFFMLIYLFFNRENSKPFLIGFLGYYVVFFIYDLAMSSKFKKTI